MPYYIGSLVDEVDDLIARTPDQFHDFGIDARTFHEVESINIQDKSVVVYELKTGERFRDRFDQLVIATGAEPVRPDLPGIDAPGLHGMASMADMLDVEQDLNTHDIQRAVIVGGGYVGLEMAEAFLLRDIQVTLIHSRTTVMPTLDQDMGQLVNAALQDAGVDLVTNEPVSGFSVRAGRVSAAVTKSSRYPGDVIVLGLGTRPRSQLASLAGIRTGPTGGIVVDERMQTDIDGVWAAGDCTEMRHLVSDEPVSFALGTIANKQGRVCGINLGGGNATFPGVLGTSITRILDTEISRTGLNETELTRLGFDAVSGRIESSTRSGYFPGAAKITVKVTADRSGGRILGCQIVGGPGSGKRIDTMATAIAAGLSVHDLEYLDLSYAPPFSPVWDPVQIAARIAGQKLTRS